MKHYVESKMFDEWKIPVEKWVFSPAINGERKLLKVMKISGLGSLQSHT